MSVLLFNHHPEPRIVLEGVGRRGEQLVIQTGTLVFDFRGSPAEGWVRDRLSCPVFELPPGSEGFGARVRATATSAPASMRYAPAPVAMPSVVGSGLWAQGEVNLGGPAHEGHAYVGGYVALPVNAVTPAGVSVPSSTLSFAEGGWAVDRTRAVVSNRQVHLVVDLAVVGPSNLFRLAYSLFVTIALGSLGVDTVLHPEPHELEP